MTITRIGATKKYANNFGQAFGKKKATSGSETKKSGSAKSEPTGKKKASKD